MRRQRIDARRFDDRGQNSALLPRSICRDPPETRFIYLSVPCVLLRSQIALHQCILVHFAPRVSLKIAACVRRQRCRPGARKPLRAKYAACSAPPKVRTSSLESGEDEAKRRLTKPDLPLSRLILWRAVVSNRQISPSAGPRHGKAN